MASFITSNFRCLFCYSELDNMFKETFENWIPTALWSLNFWKNQDICSSWYYIKNKFSYLLSFSRCWITMWGKFSAKIILVFLFWFDWFSDMETDGDVFDVVATSCSTNMAAVFWSIYVNVSMYVYNVWQLKFLKYKEMKDRGM